MEERGVKVDHSTLNRWVINYSYSLALATKKNNVLWLLRGGWMKPKSKLKGNESIYIEPLINSATPLILCFPNVEMKRRLPRFSNKPSTPTGSQRKSLWIKAVLTIQAWRTLIC